MVEAIKHTYILEEYQGFGGPDQGVLDMKGVKVRNLKEMELWMEKVPESIKKATKRESQMLDCERDTMQQEELALRKLQSANRPASAPVGSQRKRSLQNIIKSKLPNKAKGTGLTDWLRLPNSKDGSQWESSVDDPYLFSNPVPPEMQAVSMAELAAVEINWRMLTMARPTTNIDISFFSRLVELTRLKLATTRKEEKERLLRGVDDPDIVVKRPAENPGGMTVTIFKVCEACSEEFCHGACVLFDYSHQGRKARTKSVPKKTRKKNRKKCKRSTKFF